MQLKGKRFGETLLALSSLVAGTAAQALSIDSNGCYLTSSVVFGNITSPSTSTPVSNLPSTTGDGQSVSPILVSSSSSNGAGIISYTGTLPSSPISSTPPSSQPPLVSPTGFSQSPTSTSSSSSSSAPPPPVSTPFRITVSGFGTKLRARALSYITFNGDDAYLAPNEELSAIFVLTFDGQLQTDDANVGTSGSTGSLPLMRFLGQPQSSGLRWTFNNDGKLMFGDTSFSALSDGQMYVIFPGSQPPLGAVQLGLEPEFVETTSSTSSALMMSTSTDGSPTPSTDVVITTSMAASTSPSDTVATSTTPEQPISSAPATVSSLRPPPVSSLTTPHLSQMTPDSPLSSSLIPRTSMASPAQSSSMPVSPGLSSTSPPAGIQTSSVPASSARSSAATMVGVSSSLPLVQSTSAQISPITQVPSATRSPAPSSSVASPSSALTSSAAASSLALPSSFGTTVSSFVPASSAVTSASISPSSSPALSSSRTITTVPSGQPPSSSQTTTISPALSTPIPSSSTSSPTSIITTASESTTRRSFTGSRTRTSSTSTSSYNPIPTPYPAKRGLAYGNVTTLQFYPPPSPYITWSYDYYSLPNASDNVGPYPYPSSPYRFLPLLYNDANSLTSIWSTNVNFCIANYGTDAIFGFNEPDANFDGFSANMPVARSVAGYKNFMQPFAGKVKIGAPAVTNAGGGLTYLQQFLGNATQQNLTIDFLNIHWYASPYNIDYFKQFVTQAYNISIQYSPNITSSFHDTRNGGVLPIWITEFGMDQNNYDLPTTVQFLKNATLWMDQQDWVERYAWFGNYPGGKTSYGAPTTNMLLNVDGSGRSALGDVWYRFNGTN